jgi:hypothetical protein
LSVLCKWKRMETNTIKLHVDANITCNSHWTT